MKAMLSVAATLVLLAACAGTMEKMEQMVGKSGPSAQAALQPTQGNTAAGTVKFTQRGSSTLVEASLSGLKPGAHGFHIHEKGDCSAPDGMTAGGHFNPSAATHGAPGEGPHHAGDMGNVTAGADGSANVKIEVSGISVDNGPNGIVGRAVILHADADDLKTQPAGNAGKRVACGAIAQQN